jgi:hypothetical protein
MPRSHPYTAEQRLAAFYAKTMPVPFSGCLIWLAATRPFGYGVFGVGQKTYMAHRWIFENKVRPLRPGEILCHKCDVPACVNIDHLFPGTKADNSADMTGKRRHWTYCFRGEMNRTAKLDEEKVADIRRLVRKGWRHADIADIYGVHKSLISHINRGKSWAKPSGIELVGTRYE